MWHVCGIWGAYSFLAHIYVSCNMNADSAINDTIGFVRWDDCLVVLYDILCQYKCYCWDQCYVMPAALYMMLPLYSGGWGNYLEMSHDFWCHCQHNASISDTWLQQHHKWNHCIPEVETFIEMSHDIWVPPLYLFCKHSTSVFWLIHHCFSLCG